MATTNWYPSGGDWTYVSNVKDIYERYGHSIIPFAMRDKRNISNEYEDHFLDNIDYKVLNKSRDVKSFTTVLSRSIYSSEAKRKLEKLLCRTNVDIAQLNSIHNIHTPSIIETLVKHSIPVVWRILDYKLICPNRTFLSNGEICEACLGEKYYNCVIRKCKKNSYLASAVAAIESYLYSYTKHYKKVNMFLFQSEFTRDKFVEYGFPQEKTSIIENPFPVPFASDENTIGDYFLYFGRLSPEKGIMTLLKAMEIEKDVQLKIVGNGPLEGEIRSYILNRSLHNVEMLGPIWGDELIPVIRKSIAVVVPSLWYDPNPYVVLQAYSQKKPVIASRIGGLQDMIAHKETGFLFEAGNHVDLAQCIQKLSKERDLTNKYSQQAIKTLQQKYSPEKYYTKTMNIFSELLNGAELQ